MSVFKTMEEWIAYAGRPIVDKNGVEVDIGYEVVTTTNDYAPKGTKGVVVCYNGDVGVDFGKTLYGNQGSTHSLSGFLPNKTGLWISSSYIIVTTIPPEINTEVEIAKAILEATKSSKPMLFSEGKYYNLQLVENPSTETLIQSLSNSMSSRVMRFRHEANAKIRRLEAKVAELFAMPEVTLVEIKKGMRVYKEGGCIVYLLPLHYNPKFIGLGDRCYENKEVITKQLSPEHIAECDHQIFFAIYTDSKGGLIQTVCMNLDYTPFQHYHGSGQDCLGSIIPAPFKSPADAFALRDRYQKALEIVNMDSLYNDRPTGMPTARQLNDSAKESGIVDPWGAPAPALAVGVAAKVTDKTHQNKDLVGLIGKVVSIEKTSIGLEFLDKIPEGHNCGGAAEMGKGYWIEIEAVEVMPAGTRRNRKSFSAGGSVPHFSTVAEEHFAKFGTSEDIMDNICHRCGERQGNHYYGSPNPDVCPDEFAADRKDSNLSLVVEREWVEPPYAIFVEELEETTVSLPTSDSYPTVDDEIFAKFGEDNIEGTVRCHRCGVLRGEHHQAGMCLDEWEAARYNSRNTASRAIVREWLEMPFTRIEVGVAA